MLTRRIALVLRTGAVVFALSAVALLLQPQLFLNFIGVTSGNDPALPELLWAMRMIALSLLVAATMMPVVAAFASERTLRQVASLMVPISGALALLTAFAPGTWPLGRFLYVAIGIGFSLAYLYGLQGRRRNH